jgi:hypothetical protein
MPSKRIRLNRRHALIARWGALCTILAAAIGYWSARAAIRVDPGAPRMDGVTEGLTSILERRVSTEMVRFGFDDVSAAAGIRFRHFPETRRSLLPEDMGSGAAWGDYDDDQDPDLFLVNFRGSIQPQDSSTAGQGACQLYRNNGDGTFTDVSAESGLDLRLYGLAAAWADFDNDDDLDLYITCFGPNILMRNDGGSFTDVSATASVNDPGFSAGCSWADYDRDGFVDLYVCNYVAFSPDDADARQTTRYYGSEMPYTINPSSYPPQSNRLYHNNGDGTFTDVGRGAGVDNPTGRSLEAAWFDFDNDGWIDLYVANDVSANGVFRNMGDGTFADIGASSLAADYRGAMGLAVADFDHDADLDLLVTHWLAQENALFENMWSQGWRDAEGNRRITFMDSAEVVGLGHISLRMVGWATGFADFDNDGWEDLFVVNGNTLESADDTTKLRPQVTHMFWRDPQRGYFEIGAKACDALREPMVGRGGAMADFDRDGFVDLVIMRHGSSPLVLRNSTRNDYHWVGLELRQRGRNTRAIGARVELSAGGQRHVAQVDADASYLSQHDLTLHVGLGSAARIDELIIHWPDGVVQRVTNLPIDQVHRVWRDVGSSASSHR